MHGFVVSTKPWTPPHRSLDGHLLLARRRVPETRFMQDHLSPASNAPACVCRVFGLQDAERRRHPTVQTVRFTSLRDVLGGVFASTYSTCCCGFCCLASAMWKLVYRSNWGLLPDPTPICPNASTLSNMMLLCVSNLFQFESADSGPPSAIEAREHCQSKCAWLWGWCALQDEASP